MRPGERLPGSRGGGGLGEVGGWPSPVRFRCPRGPSRTHAAAAGPFPLHVRFPRARAALDARCVALPAPCTASASRPVWPFPRPVPPGRAACGPRACAILRTPPPPLVLARVRGLSRRADSAPASPARRGPGRGRRRRPPAQKGAGPPPPPLFPPGVPGRRPGRVAPGAMGAGQLATRATPGVPRCRRPLPTWGGGARGGRGSFQEKGQNAVKLGILFVSFEQALLSAGLGGRRATKNALRVTCFGCFGFEMIGFRLN